MSKIIWKQVIFPEAVVKFGDLTIYRPTLGPDYYYLGPGATGPFTGILSHGLIIKANDENAICDIVDWEPDFIDNEWGKFSTWKGVPEDPENYVVVGGFFVRGTDKPTATQTNGIKAIRKDFVHEIRGQRIIWQKKASGTKVELWDVVATPNGSVPTGAFVSHIGSGIDSRAKVHVISFDE